MSNSTYIAVDFDGTIVENKYPKIGRPIPGATKWLKKMKKEGGKLILWTCRTGKRLQEAIDYCESQGISFTYVNENPRAKNLSNKVFANVYIDDASVGIPTKLATEPGASPTVNWGKIGPAVMQMLVRKALAVPKPNVFARIWNVISSQSHLIVEETFCAE